MFILHTISWRADKENLFHNQELLWFLIISCILMTLTCDSGMILQEEIRCKSLMGIKALYLLRPYLSDIEILRSQVITGSLHVRLCSAWFTLVWDLINWNMLHYFQYISAYINLWLLHRISSLSKGNTHSDGTDKATNSASCTWLLSTKL